MEWRPKSTRFKPIINKVNFTKRMTTRRNKKLNLEKLRWKATLVTTVKKLRMKRVALSRKLERFKTRRRLQK